MTVERVFELINNLDVREALRKYAPQWSTVVVSTSGEVVDVIRAKKWNMEIQSEYMRKYPGTVQFVVKPGEIDTISKLQEKIDLCTRP